MVSILPARPERKDLMNREPLKILLVEDNPEDVLIIQMVLKKVKIPNQLFVAKDGQEALDFLYHRGKYAVNGKAPRPGLILLGIDLPKVNGIEVLRKLKSNKKLKKIPITMMARSERAEDVAKSYHLGANSYVHKPLEFNDFVRTIRSLYRYWTALVKLPS
jgi:two-component system response regulator